MRFDLTAGLPISIRDSAIFDINYVKTVSAYSSANSFLDRYGYDAMQYTIGAKRQYSNFALEYGYIIQDYARNTGIGQGVKISLWYLF